MKIYLAHPISGLSADVVFNYYDQTSRHLKENGIKVFSPMVAKDFLRNEIEFKPLGYQQPCTTNHALYNRDRWMVEMSDIVYANFMLADKVSIGMVMEIAWASLLRKHVVITMPENSIHSHAFVHEAANVVFNNHEDAMDYILNLISR